MRKFDNFVDFDPMFSTIRNLEDITPNEKILLSKIISFYINEKKCTSSNGWFATRLSVKKNTILGTFISAYPHAKNFLASA